MYGLLNLHSKCKHIIFIENCFRFTKKICNDFRSVRHEKIEILVYGEDGQDSVASHVAVLILETSTNSWHERLEELGFFELAQKAQCRAFDELVRMLQILSGS